MTALVEIVKPRASVERIYKGKRLVCTVNCRYPHIHLCQLLRNSPFQVMIKMFLGQHAVNIMLVAIISRSCRCTADYM